MEPRLAPFRIVRADEEVVDWMDDGVAGRRLGGDEEVARRRVLLELFALHHYPPPAQAERGGEVGQCLRHAGTLLASFAPAAQERYRHGRRIMDE